MLLERALATRHVALRRAVAASMFWPGVDRAVPVVVTEIPLLFRMN
jgi:hypothetical protein